MKINRWFVALSMGLAFVACQPKAEQAEEVDEASSEVAPKEITAKDFVPSRKELNDVSYLVGVNFGSFIKGYNFGDLNMAQIRKGMEDFLNATQTSDQEEFAKQFRVDPNTMNEKFNKHLQDRRNYLLYTNKEKEEKFLAANAKKPGIQVSPSGLQYKIVAPGNDVKPAATDTVWVKYKGSLLDGTVFDETPAEGEAVKLMLNRVVRGWSEGLQLIGEGGEIELYVPAALGYGDNGGGSRIEPGATLIFNVSLEKVGKVAPKE
ncbi:MAG: FKBP-type peptidyl-prolyl cis-trans isomerase [Candidatus Cryptobacteroides sp.]